MDARVAALRFNASNPCRDWAVGGPDPWDYPPSLDSCVLTFQGDLDLRSDGYNTLTLLKLPVDFPQ